MRRSRLYPFYCLRHLQPDEALPTTTPELLAELAKRAQSVTMLLDEGNLGALWNPAIGARISLSHSRKTT